MLTFFFVKEYIVTPLLTDNSDIEKSLAYYVKCCMLEVASVHAGPHISVVNFNLSKLCQT